jgi:hypothetical protein
MRRCGSLAPGGPGGGGPPAGDGRTRRRVAQTCTGVRSPGGGRRRA